MEESQVVMSFHCFRTATSEKRAEKTWKKINSQWAEGQIRLIRFLFYWKVMNGEVF